MLFLKYLFSSKNQTKLYIKKYLKSLIFQTQKKIFMKLFI